MRGGHAHSPCTTGMLTIDWKSSLSCVKPGDFWLLAVIFCVYTLCIIESFRPCELTCGNFRVASACQDMALAV